MTTPVNSAVCGKFRLHSSTMASEPGALKTITAKDTAFLLTTSGSTGKPKVPP